MACFITVSFQDFWYTLSAFYSTRSVCRLSSHFEYLKKWLYILDVSRWPNGNELTTWTDTLYWDYSLCSETLLSEFSIVWLTHSHFIFFYTLCKVFLIKHHMTQVQTTCSPHLVSSNFWLFIPLKGRNFQINEYVTKQLMAVSKEDFANCFEKWNKWGKCVSSEGQY